MVEFAIAIIFILYQFIKQARRNSKYRIPKENFRNMNLYYKDGVNGASVDQRLEWARRGRYK